MNKDYSPIIYISHITSHFRYDGLEYYGECIYDNKRHAFFWIDEIITDIGPWKVAELTNKEISIYRIKNGSRVYSCIELQQHECNMIDQWNKIYCSLVKIGVTDTKIRDELESCGFDRNGSIGGGFLKKSLKSRSPVGYFLLEGLENNEEEKPWRAWKDVPEDMMEWVKSLEVEE